MAKKKELITEKMFKDLQQELKQLNMQWVTLLVEQIKEDDTVDAAYKDLDERKVYNVFNNVVKDGAWKLLIYKQAMILKGKLEKQFQDVLK